MGIADMTVGEIAKWVVGAVLALSAIIQITPVKLNPWSWVAKHIGRAVNGEVLQKVGKLEADVKDMRASMDEQSARDARSEILRFGDELLHDMKHSKEAFDDILDQITRYDEYCRLHPDFKNKRTEKTSEHIQKTYDKCMDERSFL